MHEDVVNTAEMPALPRLVIKPWHSIVPFGSKQGTPVISLNSPHTPYPFNQPRGLNLTHIPPL